MDNVYMNLDDRKAGMVELDKDKINQLIKEASQGSLYYETQIKKEAKLKLKVDNQLKMLGSFDSHQRKLAKFKMQKFIKEATCKQDFNHTIVHIDMDAFFAAVEIRDNPSLASKPVAVGSMQMISTSNYIARRYGVRAAMAGFIGKKLCPNLVLVRHNFQKYREAAQQVRSILVQYDSKFTSGGLDEAYLDLTQYLHNVRFFGEDKARTFIFNRVCPCFCHQQQPSTQSPQPDEEVGTSKENVKGAEEFQVVTSSKTLACFCSYTWKERLVDGQFEKVKEFTTPGCDLALKKLSKTKAEETNETIEKDADPKLLEEEKEDSIAITFGIMAEEAVREIRLRIYELTGLTCSAGIAPTRLLAKIGTDINKPNGQFLLKSGKEKMMEFIGQTPINKVNGIGKVTYALLRSLGIEKCSDIWEQRESLGLLYSDVFCRFLAYIYAGGRAHELDHDESNADSEDEELGGRKSIGIERTVVHNSSRRQSLKEDGDIYEICAGLCNTLGEDMKSRNLAGTVVAVKMKSSNFRVLTRMKTLVRATNEPSIILREAWKLIQVELGLARKAASHLNLKGPNVPKAESQWKLKRETVKENAESEERQSLKIVKETAEEALNEDSLKNPYLYNYYRNFADEPCQSAVSTTSNHNAQGSAILNHEDFLTLRLLGVRMCKLENSLAYDNQTKFLTDWMANKVKKPEGTTPLSPTPKLQVNEEFEDLTENCAEEIKGENIIEMLHNLGYATNCPVCLKELKFILPEKPQTSLDSLKVESPVPAWLETLYSDTLNSHLDICLNIQTLSNMDTKKPTQSKTKLIKHNKRKSAPQESIVKFLKKPSPY